MLEAIAAKLMAKGLVTAQWQADVQSQGELVKLFRDYYDGFHRMQLTKEMKAMLNISDEKLERYNANYCELVIGSMADRLTVDKFEAKSEKKKPEQPADKFQIPANAGAAQTPEPVKDEIDPAQEWVDDLMEYNRFDALQIDVREAVLRDGETFIISQYDDAQARVCLYQELAYDGDVGTIVIYERGSSQEIAAAVKIWYDVPPTPEQDIDGETDVTLYKRVNIYYRNSTEKYFSVDGQEMTLLIDPEETVRDGKEPGVPIMPFSNKGGASELVNIIPLQDSLNSALVDLVMAGRLTAFSIVLAVNLTVPQGLTPGMTITKNVTKTVDGAVVNAVPETPEEAEQIAKYLDAARLERLPVGDLSQIIAGIELIINQIGVISSTPLPGKQMGGDSSSGEALKQRDTRLLGKLNRAQVQLGNAYEDLIRLAARQQTIFGSKAAPMIDKLNTRWKSAESRNDDTVLKLFDLLNKAGFVRAALRALGQSSLASYTEDDIEKMMNEKARDVDITVKQAGGNVPGLDQLVPAGGFNFNPVVN